MRAPVPAPRPSTPGAEHAASRARRAVRSQQLAASEAARADSAKMVVQLKAKFDSIIEVRLPTPAGARHPS